VTRELLARDDARIDVLIDDKGRSRETIVLLPSSQRDSLDFNDVAQGLADQGFRVLRPQPRGMGHSSAPLAGLTLQTLAADVAHVIKQLGGGRAIVAGHAYGHYVARVTDLQHPANVRGVVLLAAAAREPLVELSASLDIAADNTRPEAERLKHLRQAFFAPGNDASVWLEGWYPQWRALYRLAAASPSKAHWWETTHSPILEVQGAQDPWRPPASRLELQDKLGDTVSLCLINDASHALIPEQPEQVIAAIVGWSRGLSP
jgi:pimeloyl-ACP methyl ester carboxylesterase